jgi:transposase
VTKSELRNPRPTKRNLDAMEARRKKGMGLLARGVTQAEVARRCEVSTPTALRWRRALEAKCQHRSETHVNLPV